MFRRLQLACLSSLALTLTTTARAEDAAALLAAIEERTVSLIADVEPSIVSIVSGRTGGDRLAAGRVNAFNIAPGPFRGRFNDFPQFPQPSDADFVPEQFGAGVVIGSLLALKRKT